MTAVHRDDALVYIFLKKQCSGVGCLYPGHVGDATLVIPRSCLIDRPKVGEAHLGVEIPNTQWALYPMGGGISAGGAVITAWFFTAPFITAHVDGQ